MFSRGDYLTEYKLALLYLLDRAAVPLSAAQIDECVILQGLMNYFDVREAMAELAEVGLIYTHNGDPVRYSSSITGRAMLGQFKARLSAAVRDQMDAYLAENTQRMRQQNACPADCFSMPNGSYLATLSALEDDECVLDMALVLPDKNTAALFAARWPERAADIYQLILERLLAD